METNAPPRIEPTVVDLIRADALQNGLAQLAEAGLDQLLDDGFLRDVPVLGSVIGGLRAVGAVRDLLLAKKLGRFLREVHSAPTEERTRFADALKDPSERHRTGEALILLLDRLDDMDKPTLIGKIFRALLSGDIDRTTFRRMAMAIDRLSKDELAQAVAFYLNKEQTIESTDSNLWQALAFAGLVHLEARGDGGGWFHPSMAGAKVVYQHNELGESLARILSAV